jgi:RND family efflux transporter MFP subunit
MPAKPNNSRFGLTLGLVLLVLAAAGVYFGLGVLRPVAKVATVIPGLATDSVSGSLLVAAHRVSQLTSEIGGRVLRNDLDPGKIVKDNEVVAQIDPGDLDLEIEKIESDYAAAKKRIAIGSAIKFEYDAAVENLLNAQRQHDRGSLSDLDLSRQKRAVDAIKYRQDQEDISNTQLLDGYVNTLKVKHRQREKMTILAPFDGVVATVFAHKTDQIASNATIATIITISREVQAKISEENFAKVQIGQRAVVRFLTYGDDKFDATVIEKRPTAELNTQRYVALLEVKIPQEKLLPDLTGEVSVIVGERQTKTQIPRRAVTDSNVFVVKDGRVEKRRIKLGYTSVNLAEVLEGLQPGEQVIVDELDLFHDGQRVRAESVAAK